MPPLAVAFVLAAALVHAMWNIAAKHAGGNRHFALQCSLALVVLWAPAAWWVGVGAVADWGLLQWAFVSASGVVHVLYFTTLLRGYRESDLTVVYPAARGTGPLISSVGAMLLLRETPSVWTLVGIAGVVGGLVLVAGGPALWRRAHDPQQHRRLRSGLAWGGATGVLIAGYTLIDGYAVKVLVISPVLVDYFGNLCRVPLMVPGAWRDQAGFVQAWRAQWKHVLFVAALSPLSYILVLYAARIAPLSHVAPAREISMLFASLIGGRLLGEADRGLRLAGALCMAVGVAALALG